MALSQASKAAFVADALRAYSEDLTLLDDRNPIRVRLNGADYSIHVSSIHQESRGDASGDGRRIQVTQGIRLKQQERQASGQTALFIGLFPDGESFSAWEPEHVFAQANSTGGSLYSYWSHQSAIRERGAALKIAFSDKLGRDSHTVSMRATALGFYMENAAALHRAMSSEELQEVTRSLHHILDSPDGSGRTEKTVTISGHAEKVTVTRKAYPRDPKFTREVLGAYRHSCAICQRQLGLIQAAHIIPHNQDDCPNHVTNGVALCVEHHRLYDDQLLLLGPEGTLHINENRVEHLRNINQTAGLQEVRDLAANGYRLPDDPGHHPNPEYLARGLKIRLGKGG